MLTKNDLLKIKQVVDESINEKIDEQTEEVILPIADDLFRKINENTILIRKVEKRLNKRIDMILLKLDTVADRVRHNELRIDNIEFTVNKFNNNE